MKSKILFFLLAIVSVIVLAACNDSAGTAESSGTDGNGSGVTETIKLGMTAPITGPISDYGEGATRAAQIAIDEWNEKGGINGQKIELIELDDQAIPDRATTNVQQLIQKEKVHAAFMPISSASAMAALPHAVSSNLPFLNVMSQAVEITYPNGTDNEPYPNIFTFALQSDIEAAGMAEYIPELGYKKLAFLAESTPYGQTGLDIVGELLKEDGIEIVGREQYDQQATSVSAQLAKLEDKKPEALFVIGLAPDVATIMKDMHRLGMDIPVITSTGSAAPQFKNLAGELVVGVNLIIIPTFAEKELHPKAQKLVDSYIERHGKDYWFDDNGDPSAFFTTLSNHYDATNFILSSIEKADSLDSKAIIAEMNKMEISGSTYKDPVQFSETKHHAVSKDQFRIGKYVSENGKITFEIVEE